MFIILNQLYISQPAPLADTPNITAIPAVLAKNRIMLMRWAIRIWLFHLKQASEKTEKYQANAQDAVLKTVLEKYFP